MKLFKSYIFTIIVALFPLGTVIGAPPEVNGEVYAMTGDSKLKQIQKFKFQLRSISDPTSIIRIQFKNWMFKNEVLEGFEVGEKVQIIIPGNYWKVIEPSNATFFIPKRDNFNKLIIKVRRNTIANDKTMATPLHSNDSNKPEPVYAVQIFAGASKKRAFLAVNKLIDKGYESVDLKEKVMADSTIFYHVYAGKYPSKKRALEIKNTIDRDKYFSAYKQPYIIKLD